MVRALVLFGFLVAGVAADSGAQERERKYVLGIRSGLINGSMDLSGLDPAFDDLAYDGPRGPHMSGFFLMYRVRPQLRVGVETLVANSDQDAVTTMNYQAAGPVLEVSYGKRWFVAGGIHAGGLIVNAMARAGAAPAGGATTGSYFKGSGAFAAPYADLGYRFRRSEVGVYVKQVNIAGEKARGGITEFSSRFLGVRFAVGL